MRINPLQSKIFTAAIAASVCVLLGGTAIADEARPERGAAPSKTDSAPAEKGAVLEINRAELEDALQAGLPEGVELAGPLHAPDRPVSPMMLEIRGVMDAAQAESELLHQRFAAASNEQEALAVQRELEKLMQDSEIEILHVQARYARERGDQELADEIESSIAKILEPEVPVARKDRPRPQFSN